MKALGAVAGCWLIASACAPGHRAPTSTDDAGSTVDSTAPKLDASVPGIDSGSSADGGVPLCSYMTSFTATWQQNGASTTGLHDPKFDPEGYGLWTDLEQPLEGIIAGSVSASLPSVTGTLTITPTNVAVTFNPPIANLAQIQSALGTLLATNDPTKRVLVQGTHDLTTSERSMLLNIGLNVPSADVGFSFYTGQGSFGVYYCITGLSIVTSISD